MMRYGGAMGRAGRFNVPLSRSETRQVSLTHMLLLKQYKLVPANAVMGKISNQISNQAPNHKSFLPKSKLKSNRNFNRIQNFENLKVRSLSS